LTREKTENEKQKRGEMGEIAAPLTGRGRQCTATGKYDEFTSSHEVKECHLFGIQCFG